MIGFQEKIPSYIEIINKYISSVLPHELSKPRKLSEAMHYASLNGGKRIRPLLTFATAETIRVDIHTVTPAAVSIELLHCFSLAHDDLPSMDDDKLRRGKPSLHIAFGEAIAILAADALQSLAFEILASDPILDQKDRIRSSLANLIATASGISGMTGGQALDLEAEGKNLSIGELENIYQLKTGKLLRASVIAPTHFKEITETEINALEEYINSVGLAFQIQDDIIEIEGNSKVIGKPSGSDIDNKKATFPKIIGLDASKQRVIDLINQSNEAISLFGEKCEGLRYLAKMIIERNY
ncbi:MAG: polyprenyl synthetase family protein [Gammaproteobacteria bacterium]|nr:polyprenyl synthetase family protein [Gammaproteobacteria bacterium]